MGGFGPPHYHVTGSEIYNKILKPLHADVAELVDALVLGTSVL